MSSPRIVAAVFARLSSNRLPGKALIMVDGRAVIDYTIQALEQVSDEMQICLATSSESSDDPLEEYAKANDLPCVRGNLHDVAHRLVKVLEEIDCDAVFRVNGDSPLVQPSLFQKAIAAYSDERWDLITNIWPRTFPPGVSVELIDSEFYQKLYQELDSDEDKEHVTRYIYNNHERYKILNLKNQRDYSHYHLAIDTPADMDQFRCMIRLMERNHFEYSIDELVRIHELAREQNQTR